MHIRISKALRTCCMVALLVSSGATQGQAILTINGRVTTTPCVLNLPGPVVLGQVSQSSVRSGESEGEAFRVPFRISVTGCTLRTFASASLTFTGTLAPGFDDASGLALDASGGPSAAGVAIHVITADTVHGQNRLVRFDGSQEIAFNLQNLRDDRQYFDFKAFFVQVPRASVVAGPVNAVATVTLTHS